MGLQIGQRCRRWMNFFQKGQLSFSISCCHLGPNTFFWISGLLIPMVRLRGWLDQKTQMATRKRSEAYIVRSRERLLQAEIPLKISLRQGLCQHNLLT